MRVCFIGNCGHSKQAYASLKKRSDVVFCGMAPGSTHETINAAFDESIPLFADYEKMLNETRPDLAVVSPVFGLTGQITIECAKRGIKGVKVVWSEELPREPHVDPSTDAESHREGSSRRALPGSTAFVPGVAGLIMAGEVIRDLSGCTEVRK